MSQKDERGTIIFLECIGTNQGCPQETGTVEFVFFPVSSYSGFFNMLLMYWPHLKYALGLQNTSHGIFACLQIRQLDQHFKHVSGTPPQPALCILLPEHKAPWGTQPWPPLSTSFDSAQTLFLVPLPRTLQAKGWRVDRMLIFFLHFQGLNTGKPLFIRLKIRASAKSH